MNKLCVKRQRKKQQSFCWRNIYQHHQPTKYKIQQKREKSLSKSYNFSLLRISAVMYIVMLGVCFVVCCNSDYYICLASSLPFLMPKCHLITGRDYQRKKGHQTTWKVIIKKRRQSDCYVNGFTFVCSTVRMTSFKIIGIFRKDRGAPTCINVSPIGSRGSFYNILNSVLNVTKYQLRRKELIYYFKHLVYVFKINFGFKMQQNPMFPTFLQTQLVFGAPLPNPYSFAKLQKPCSICTIIIFIKQFEIFMGQRWQGEISVMFFITNGNSTTTTTTTTGGMACHCLQILWSVWLSDYIFCFKFLCLVRNQKTDRNSITYYAI